MKQLFTRPSKFADWLVALVLVLVPFHAFLTVWGSALVGHYTLLRGWDDVVLLVLFGVSCYWLARDNGLRKWFMGSLLVRLVLAYALLNLLLGFVSLAKGDVVFRALAYGWLLDLRFLAWFLAVLLAAQRSSFLGRVWPKLLLVPAGLVVAFATLQYVALPHDFLAHFGYHANSTIAPIETINHNNHYIRVQSTLRGANPLGAYLVLVLSALGVFWTRGRRRVVSVVFGLVALFALYASGSRSAWIGAALSLGVLAWLQLKTLRARLIFGGAALGVVAVAATGFLLLHNNAGIQNAVLHTQTHSASKISSNDAHASALTSGLRDVVRQPFGDGPGTAGPASEHNTGHPARIAENYYVQVAQETGWLGLGLLLAITVLIVMELYQRLGTSPLALTLFVSFVGLAFVNLLSHAWADDTLAFLWWGLAGVALGSARQKRKA